MVTLRGDRMYEFLDRLLNIALPRVRDFKGVSTKGFDGRGNYTLGLRDQLLFPEIDYMKVDKARGMNVSVVTTAKTDEEARRLLQLLGHAVPGPEPERGPNMATTAKNSQGTEDAEVRDPRCATAAGCAGARAATSGSSPSAASASASWRSRATSPASSRAAGDRASAKRRNPELFARADHRENDRVDEL